MQEVSFAIFAARARSMQEAKRWARRSQPVRRVAGPVTRARRWFWAAEGAGGVREGGRSGVDDAEVCGSRRRRQDRRVVWQTRWPRPERLAERASPN